MASRCDQWGHTQIAGKKKPPQSMTTAGASKGRVVTCYLSSMDQSSSGLGKP